MLKRQVLLITVMVIGFSSCKNSQKTGTEENPKAAISFESTVHDFGTIPFDSDGRCYFEFTNTSDVPLVVNVVRTSCGCTRPEWPEEPVSPGGKGKIGITYNTRLPGNFQKSITVYSNAEDSPVKLMIKGKVEVRKRRRKT